MKFACQLLNGGSAPAPPGFNAIAPEGLPGYGAAITPPPAIPAAESALGSHPCVALSSAQVLPEWISLTSSCNSFSANGDYPLNFVSHSRGSLQPAPDPLGPRRTWSGCAKRRETEADEGVGRGPGGPPYIADFCSEILTQDTSTSYRKFI